VSYNDLRNLEKDDIFIKALAAAKQDFLTKHNADLG
jgi:hypothetical protein